jgi:uncharacterized protein YecE (DUF72 family)
MRCIAVPSGARRPNRVQYRTHVKGFFIVSARILVGTCNWSDHAGFYPTTVKPADRLAYYARFFPIVEVDSTFYHPPSERNAARWAAMTPDAFIFNLKAYRALTLHERDARGNGVLPTPEIAAQFRKGIAPLKEAGKVRAILFQFPPWFTATGPHRDYLRQVRELFPDDLIAAEFRHRSWLAPAEQERTFATLRGLAIVYTIVDEPQGGWNSVPPTVAVTNPELAIVRFHGRNQETWNNPALKGTMERYNYRYSQGELTAWAADVQRIAAEAREVHLLFNNNAGNHAAPNALEMQQLLGIARHAPEEAVMQPRLF